MRRPVGSEEPIGWPYTCERLDEVCPSSGKTTVRSGGCDACVHPSAPSRGLARCRRSIAGRCAQPELRSDIRTTTKGHVHHIEDEQSMGVSVITDQSMRRPSFPASRPIVRRVHTEDSCVILGDLGISVLHSDFLGNISVRFSQVSPLSEGVRNSLDVSVCWIVPLRCLSKLARYHVQSPDSRCSN